MGQSHKQVSSHKITIKSQIIGVGETKQISSHQMLCKLCHYLLQESLSQVKVWINVDPVNCRWQ